MAFNSFDQYVAELSSADHLAIIDGYNTLEKTGMIGDEPIRLHAQTISTKFGIHEFNVVMVMGELCRAVYKLYARDSLEALRGLISINKRY